jgi:immunity protein 74 of polymorphic toxin system
MFSIPRVNVIESDSGFSVEVLPGRAGGLLYIDNGRSLVIDSELLVGPVGLGIWSSSIKEWDPPHSTEQFDEATKARIIENIRAAFRFRGSEIQVV